MTTGPEIPFQTSARYPDPRIEVLDDRFLKLRLFSSSVEQLFSGMRWAEGPVWFGDARHVLVSDIPNNRILKWNDASGELSVFREPAHYANGLTRDAQGRLLTCEHQSRRVTRTEYDGRITVLADQYGGKRLNSPNDIVCDRRGNVWFTDPAFGIASQWEGDPAPAELPTAVYRLSEGVLHQVLDDLLSPNGLAFSPDERILYVIESRATPSRKVWGYDHDALGQLSHKRLVVDANGPGALDGMAVDALGNLWCGWGSDGSAGARAEELDGVRVFSPAGEALGHIHLPERCANLCFGGPKNNRLFMASSHSLYALYTNTGGASGALPR